MKIKFLTPGTYFALAGLLVAVSAPVLCVAAEWSVKPSVSLREDYNDNIQLSTLPHDSIWSTVVTPAVNFSRETGTDAVSAGARFSARRYSGNQITDRNDQYYTFSGQRSSDKNQLGVVASLTRDSAAGQVLNQRDYITLNPSWTVRLDEKNSVKVDYQYDKSKYLDAVNISQTGYDNRSLSGKWTYLFSELDEISASAYMSKYKTSTGSRKSDSSNIQAGIKHKFSETLLGAASVGRRTIKNTVKELQCVGGYVDTFLVDIFGFFFPIQDLTCNAANYGYTPTVSWQYVDKVNTESGSVLTFSLNQNTETSGMGAEFKRSVSPSGTGYLVETDSVNLSANKSLTSNLTMRLNVNATDNRYVGNVSSGNDNRYYSINPTLNWRMTEWWTLDAGYGYTSQKYKAATSSASSNAVYVNLTYNWPKISVSR